MGPLKLITATLYGLIAILLLPRTILSEPSPNFDCHYFNNTECDQERKNTLSTSGSKSRCKEKTETCSIYVNPHNPSEHSPNIWSQSDGNKMNSMRSSYNLAHTSTDSSTSSSTLHLPTCFVVWSNDSIANPITKENYTIKVMNKGCWTEPRDCNDTCVDIRPFVRNIRFCCCRGHLCNSKFKLEPLVSPPSEEPPINTIGPDILWISSSVSSLVVIMCVLSVCFYFRRRSNRNANMAQYEMPGQDEASRLPLQPNNFNDKNGIIDLNKVELIEQLATGRYGTVHRAKAQLMANNEIVDVAVKISSPQEFQALQNEQQVYCLPQMKHANILKFYCSEKKIDNDGLNFSLWLITDYMQNGSLHDYLKANTITWKELLHIAQGIACGMQHLHEDIIATHDQARKPSVAHRDFKSKNVLLKSNLTPCVADFGLAYIFYPDQPVSTKHGQIGTRRYMAPEILGGSIGFTADAFIKIDMYAVGLVMWELISRCTISETIRPTDPYMLPFEKEAGPMPTTETMHKIVCIEHRRPILKDEWYNNPETELFCKSIEESWDNDPEARSSAANIFERVKKMLTRYTHREHCDRIEEDLE